jgi:phage internal scaffolding protein
MSISLTSRLQLPTLIHSSIRSAYSLISPVSLSFPSVSPHTRQEFRDECDINVIMRRYQSTGELPVLNQGNAQFLDVSASLTFQESMNFIADAQSMFNELPSAVRDRFYNDPAQFLDFCSNDDNRTQLAEMGLLSPEATRELLFPSSPPLPTASPKETPPAPPAES